MNNCHERGVALVLALFLMSAMSVLAASLMFLSQTETYASMNYRMMSQSRYGGEAAIQKAADFLLDPFQYTLPSFTSGIDPLANFDYSSSPVRCLSGCTVGRPIVLSAVDGVDSNYPAPSVQTAFNTAALGARGSLPAGNTTVEYGAYATLISMQTFTSYGGGQDVIQTWQITGIGKLTGARNATVEVVATIETPKVPANNLAAFATDPSCGSVFFHGNVTVNSYDSRYGPPGTGPGNSTQADGGDIGTNGNLHIEGSTDVQGNVYTPRTGVGSCTEEPVTALTEDASFTTGDIIELPAVVSYDVPTFTAPYNATVTINASTIANVCTDLAAASPSVIASGVGQNCFIDGTTVTLGADGVTGDISLPNISVGNSYTLIFEGNSSPAQTFNINSLSGMGAIEIEANTDMMDSNEAVVLKVAGLDIDGMTELAVPLDLDQMAWKQNSTATSYDASAFQIIYGGSGAIQMTGGNNQSAVTIYAPNADFQLSGTQDLFGSVLAGTVESFGNAGISYDRRLGRDFYVAGRPMVGTFTWKRF